MSLASDGYAVRLMGESVGGWQLQTAWKHSRHGCGKAGSAKNDGHHHESSSLSLTIIVKARNGKPYNWLRSEPSPTHNSKTTT